VFFPLLSSQESVASISHTSSKTQIQEKWQ
jgi:hypothetical protein